MRSLRVVVIGGGPGGLFLGRLVKIADESATVHVYERNGPDDAFGFGVVFSDRTMSSFRAADPKTYGLIEQASVSWSDMEMRLPSGRLRFGGYGFTAISRRTLLHILQDQAEHAGVQLHFHSELSAAGLRGAGPGPDVVVLADGLNSANRDSMSDRFGTRIEGGAAKYIWFGTPAAFDAVTFPFVVTEHGAFGAHAYPYEDGMSTFIVETDEATWRAAGMDVSTAAAQEPGSTDDYSRQLLADAFCEHLRGEPLVGNNSRWATFRVVHNARWSAGNAVLLGDAAHTAHFSVGSGTKLAMEDAIALAAALRESPSVAVACASYEAARRGPVSTTQRWAERSMRWWESFGRRLHLPPHQFGFHFVTRTGAITYSGLTRRHADRIDDAEEEFASRVRETPADRTGQALSGGALGLGCRLGPVRLGNRLAAVLTGDLATQLSLAAGHAAAGSSLVLVDARTEQRMPQMSEWSAVVKELADVGGVLGVVVGTPVDPNLLGVLADAGGVVELVYGPGTLRQAPALAAAVLDEFAGGVAVVAALACPPASPWSRRGDEVLRVCRALHEAGVAGIHLREQPSRRGWAHLCDWSDRIGTETGLSTIADGPDGWALQPNRAGDDWATTLHVAVVSGRVDVVAAAPLTRVSR